LALGEEVTQASIQSRFKVSRQQWHHGLAHLCRPAGRNRRHRYFGEFASGALTLAKYGFTANNVAAYITRRPPSQPRPQPGTRGGRSHSLTGSLQPAMGSQDRVVAL
jgi:hypothetical protein